MKIGNSIHEARKKGSRMINVLTGMTLACVKVNLNNGRRPTKKKGKVKATPPRRARSLQSGQTPDGQVHALDIYFYPDGDDIYDYIFKSIVLRKHSHPTWCVGKRQ